MFVAVQHLFKWTLLVRFLKRQDIRPFWACQLQATTHTVHSPLVVSLALFCLKFLCYHSIYSLRQLLGPGSETSGGSGQSSRALYDFMTDHNKHCTAPCWVCLHTLLKMPNSSRLLCCLCCWRCGWWHPTEARTPSWDLWSALSHAGRDCHNWNCSSTIQD